MYCTPGADNSNLIRTENAVPSSPENNANIRYKVPISLALLERNHLSFHIEIPAVLGIVLSCITSVGRQSDSPLRQGSTLLIVISL